jgi:hypothetical protein
MRSLTFPLKSIRTELSFRVDPYKEDEGSFANFGPHELKPPANSRTESKLEKPLPLRAAGVFVE